MRFDHLHCVGVVPEQCAGILSNFGRRKMKTVNSQPFYSGQIACKLRGPCKHTAVRGLDRTSLPHMPRVESPYRRNKHEGDEARCAHVGSFHW